MRDFLFTALSHRTFERHNYSEKLDNGETEAELKNYLPQIREWREPTVPRTSLSSEASGVSLSPTKTLAVQLN